MATVTVNHNFSQFRIKVSPGMVLNDVLSESLKHFGLSQEQPNSDGKWGLTYNNKAIELDVPWRLMNLPTGVKLHLEALNNSEEDKIIKVRIQAPGYSSKVASVNVNKNFKDFLQNISKDSNWPLNDPNAKLQFFTKTIPLCDLNGETLKTLGIMESLSIKLIFSAQDNAGLVNAPNTSKAPMTEIKEKQVEEQEEQKEQKEPEKNHSLHKVLAYKPSDETIASQLNFHQQNGDPELTIEHARRYRQMVQRQTGGLGGPMIPRWVREKQEAVASRTKVVQSCLVRIRFPDRTYIEVAFKNNDTMSTVYQVVKSSLLDENLSFTLYQSHPHIPLEPGSQRLVEDLQFGCKTLLLFGTREKGSFLKNELLENAKDLADADDVKLNRSDKIEADADENTQGILPEPKHSEPKKSTPGKYPKWLKLSKK